MSEITLNAEKLERAIKAAGFRLKLGVKQYELVPLLPRLTKPTADDHPAACTNCGDPLPTTVSCAYCGHPHRVAADDQARRDAAVAALIRKAIYYPDGELRESAEVLAIDFMKAERIQ